MPKTKRKKSFGMIMKQQYQFLILTVPFMLLVILFSYVPIWGWIYAFFEADRTTLLPNFEKFQGLDMFLRVFEMNRFWDAVRNTLVISIGTIIVGFVCSITFALLLNEIRLKWFKRSVQTISYLPHFISWVVAASMISVTLSPDGGIVNVLLLRFGLIDAPYNFLISNSPTIWWVFILSSLWKTLGWNSIIYLSTMSGIDPGLYEAAEIDGAGRIKRIWHVTLPGIKPVISILMILAIGNLLRVGFEQYYLLQRGLTLEFSEVIETLAYRTVWSSGAGTRFHRQVSLATAIGMMQSVISIILLFTANRVNKAINGERLF